MCLENPNDVSVSSIREIADAANVKPNTFVRMARSVGLDGYEDFANLSARKSAMAASAFPTAPAGCNRWRKGGKLVEALCRHGGERDPQHRGDLCGSNPPQT